MTTTGSSRYHTILKDIGPRIVIVEEAAEVFESHIVAALSKSCEHLILIGDHIQLRPNPNVYKLAQDYHLDVSLFERLINNDTKKVMLTVQHRMRPEISTLMKHFYDNPIQDGDKVKQYTQITRGLLKSLFFIAHNQPEDDANNANKKTNSSSSSSKSNKFEAKYLAKFCEYLIKQKEFKKHEITVLSMYLGQMVEIKNRLKKLKLENIKVTTVDNYQGEENEIIVLSLVRSRNRENKIGFLNVANRVCVALSRARKGLYVIGNFEFICRAETNQLWKKIIAGVKGIKQKMQPLNLTINFYFTSSFDFIKNLDQENFFFK